MFAIFDWAGNSIFDDEKFYTFDDAASYLSEYLSNEYDESKYDELMDYYEIQELEE